MTCLGCSKRNSLSRCGTTGRANDALVKFNDSFEILNKKSQAESREHWPKYEESVAKGEAAEVRIIKEQNRKLGLVIKMSPLLHS